MENEALANGNDLCFSTRVWRIFCFQRLKKQIYFVMQWKNCSVRVAIKLLNDLEKLLLQMDYKKCDKLDATTISAASQTINGGEHPIKTRFSNLEKGLGGQSSHD